MLYDELKRRAPDPRILVRRLQFSNPWRAVFFWCEYEWPLYEGCVNARRIHVRIHTPWGDYSARNNFAAQAGLFETNMCHAAFLRAIFSGYMRSLRHRARRVRWSIGT